MPSVDGRLRALGVVFALVVLAFMIFSHSVGHQPAADALVPVRDAPPAAPVRELRFHFAETSLSIARSVARPEVVAMPAGVFLSAAPVVLTTKSKPVSRQSAIAPTMPYTHLGFIEADSGKKVVLAHGDLLLLKYPGERVDNEFSLATIDPPALLHLPTRTLIHVPRPAGFRAAEAATNPISPMARLLSSQPMIASAARQVPPAEIIDAAEIEADIAVALAAPVPEPLIPSSFPLAR